MRDFSIVRTLLAVLLLSIPLIAAERQWQDAKLIAVSDAPSSTAVAIPTGTTAVAAGFPKLYYSFQTAQMIYVLSWDGGMHWHRPNVTVNKSMKFALDGKNAHFVDDDGKDIKLPIALKIAKP